MDPPAAGPDFGAPIPSLAATNAFTPLKPALLTLGLHPQSSHLHRQVEPPTSKTRPRRARCKLAARQRHHDSRRRAHPPSSLAHRSRPRQQPCPTTFSGAADEGVSSLDYYWGHFAGPSLGTSIRPSLPPHTSPWPSHAPSGRWGWRPSSCGVSSSTRSFAHHQASPVPPARPRRQSSILL